MKLPIGRFREVNLAALDLPIDRPREHWQVLLDIFLSVIWHATLPDVDFCTNAVPAPVLLLAEVSH